MRYRDSGVDIDKANEAAYHTFREKAWTTWLGAQNMLASAVEDGVEVDGGEQLLQKARETFDLATSIDMFNDVYEHIDNELQYVYHYYHVNVYFYVNY